MRLRPAESDIGRAKERGRLVAMLERRGIRDAAVLQAMRDVPRHRFVDGLWAGEAYHDIAMPIDRGQTISQPYVVALMTQAALAGAPRLGRVLEIGTGSGYQAAVLAAVAREVVSLERIESLHRSAARILTELGIRNVTLRVADGGEGWPAGAPYEAVVVTAAAAAIPDAWPAQLAEGGRLVVPLDASMEGQDLIVLTRGREGTVRRTICAVRFVPLLPGITA